MIIWVIVTFTANEFEVWFGFGVRVGFMVKGEVNSVTTNVNSMQVL